MLGFFDFASANSLDPQTAADFGDGFLLEQGFTLLWVGWQFDAPETAKDSCAFTSRPHAE